MPNGYDSFAEGYTAENESNLINGYYGKPAILNLAGDVAGRRLGPDADLHLADLGSPLPFPGNAFDDVIACSVLHYLEDLTGPLAELRRVLKPGGRLIAAVEHPFAIEFMYHLQGVKAPYVQTRSRTEEWTYGGHSGQVTFWDRPLHAMTDAFIAADFRIAVISEPPRTGHPPRTTLQLHQRRQPHGILRRLVVLRPGSQPIAFDPHKLSPLKRSLTSGTAGERPPSARI